ncbi:MAG: NAD(P)H-dependent oxidoreductase [Sphingomonadaceae bacterium]|nr:NAD(P)H-dependent oxidoreductase [Sphingomonadaceae bacterium]
MKILAFAGSSSRRSINRALARHALGRLKDIFPAAEAELADLNDFETPLYSIDREEAEGIPASADRFRAKIQEADLILISFAEHNGSYAVAYKNLFDWMSRLEGKVYQDSKLVLLSASPGGRGGATVMEHATATLPHHGAQILGTLSFPRFYDIFDIDRGELRDREWTGKLDELLSELA